jgi:DNA-binding MarR family transcriptional regulator
MQRCERALLSNRSLYVTSADLTGGLMTPSDAANIERKPVPFNERASADASPDGLPMYELIELFFFAYRDFVRDADRVLEAYGFGRAHHRVLHFVSRRPGLTIAQLLDILQITKQSLNRVLRELLEKNFITARAGERDRRRRQLYATLAGERLALRLAEVQTHRFAAALARTGEVDLVAATNFLNAMTDAKPPLGRVEAEPEGDEA